MNKKAELFNQLLDGQPENVFEVREIGDDFHTVVYRSKLNINDKEFFFVVVFDDTDTTVVNLLIDEENVTPANRSKVLDFCNNQNRSTRFMRYYVDDQERVMVDCCLIAKDETFKPEAVATLIDALAEAVAGSEAELKQALG